MPLWISDGADMGSNSFIMFGALALFSMGCATPAAVQGKTADTPVVVSEPVVDTPKVAEVQAGTPSQISDEERAARIKDILQLFDQMTPRFEACYQESDKDWGGQVKLQLRLDPSGNLVEQGWDEMPNAALRTCVEKVVQSQWFGAPAPTERFSVGLSFNNESGTVAHLMGAQMISMVVEKGQVDLEDCFKSSLTRSNWQGEVDVSFVLDSLGGVQSVMIESTGDDEIKKCMKERFSAFECGAKGRTRTTVKKKIIFKIGPE